MKISEIMETTPAKPPTANQTKAPQPARPATPAPKPQVQPKGPSTVQGGRGNVVPPSDKQVAGMLDLKNKMGSGQQVKKNVRIGTGAQQMIDKTLANATPDQLKRLDMKLPPGAIEPTPDDKAFDASAAAELGMPNTPAPKTVAPKPVAPKPVAGAPQSNTANRARMAANRKVG